jgi:hypothetical protein
MKVATLLALLPVASAFMAPMPKSASRGRSLKMAFENEAGVTAPLGYWVRRTATKLIRYASPSLSSASAISLIALSHPLVSGACLQDPLGLSADGDQEKFNKYRANEIKHGRSKSHPPIERRRRAMQP